MKRAKAPVARLVFAYAGFAVLATLVNLAFQFISLSVYAGSGALYVAMFFGTLFGLICKYVLDKKFIFHHKSATRAQDTKKFIIYSFFGGFTTIIFWLFELGFDALFESQAAKYAGAATGLAIGYTIKYFLDKNFVFKEHAL